MIYKVRLLEAINYDYYKDKLQPNLFKSIIDIDPTPEKYFSQWIINTYFNQHKIKNLVKFYNKENEEYGKKIEYPLSENNIISLSAVAYDFNQMLNSFGDEEVNLTYLIIKRLKRLEDFLKDAVILRNANKLKPMSEFKTFQEFVKYITSDQIKNLIEEIKINSVKPNHYKIIYEDEYWKIIVPFTKAASCKFGTKTTWCTASTTTNYFNSYTDRKDRGIEDEINENDLFIFIDKQAPDGTVGKYQLHPDKDEFNNAENEELNETEYTREDLISSLSEEAKKILFEYTGSILFHPQVEQVKEKLLNNKDVLWDLVRHIENEGWHDLFNYYGQTMSSYFRQEIEEALIEEYTSENTCEEPWNYLDEPEYADQIDEEDRGEDWKENINLWSEEQIEEATKLEAESHVKEITYRQFKYLTEYVMHYDFMDNALRKVLRDNPSKCKEFVKEILDRSIDVSDLEYIHDRFNKKCRDYLKIQKDLE